MYINYFCILLINIFPYSLTKIFPIIDNKIKESEISQIKSINITNYEDYLNYIQNSTNVITLFHVDWCGHCRHFIPILDKASTYYFINKIWVFLKINCSIYSYICSILNVQFYPTIKIFKNQKIIYKEPPRDLEPLLKFLYKLSDSSIIEINSKNDFLNIYGEQSPLIEYKNNTEENEFIKCIKNLSENEFIMDFYFGLYESKNNEEKIIFDYNNNEFNNLTYNWDGNCSNAFNFLYENKYPLLNEINSNFLKDVSRDLKTLVFVVTVVEFEKNNLLVLSEMKKMAFNERKYIFGYADYDKDKDISNYFGFKLNNTNDILLIIYDFNKRKYYIHNKIFNSGTQDKNEIINEIKYIVKNIDKLKFTTGSKFKDLFNFINFDEMSPHKQIVVVGIFVFILICIIYCLFHLSDTNYEDNSEDEYDKIAEEINRLRIEKNKKKKTDEINKDNSVKEKIE